MSINKQQFVAGVTQKYPAELLEFRINIEANIIACIFKDPDILSETNFTSCLSGKHKRFDMYTTRSFSFGEDKRKKSVIYTDFIFSNIDLTYNSTILISVHL